MRWSLVATRRRLARFPRAADGATAVEFALIAFPFFLLLFAIIEVALVFMVSTSLENSLARSARTIRTGELQNANAARAVPKTPAELSADFRTEVCANLGWLQGQCASNLSIDVRTFAQFNTVNGPDPVRTTGGNTTFDETALTFQPGGATTIVLVRAFYRWRVITPLLSPGLIDLSDGSHLVLATAIFRSEPYT